MSDIKTSEQIEFSELWERLKKQDPDATHKEVSVVTGLTPSQVSQILKGKRGTRPNNVEKLRAYVEKICGDSSSYQLREGGAGDVEIWRKRAKDAEKELADLRNGLRSLLESSFSRSHKRPKPEILSSSPGRIAHSDSNPLSMGELGEAIDQARDDDSTERGNA